MTFPLFLRGMLIALAAFAITTYVATQSVWTTLVWTLGCAALIQAGYFATVLILIWGSPRRRDGGGDAPQDRGIQASAKNGEPLDSPGREPRATRS